MALTDGSLRVVIADDAVLLREGLVRLVEESGHRWVLSLMAEGGSNAAIARQLVVSESAVEKHVTSIFAKLRLHPHEEQHRRVMAVLAYLRGGAWD